MQKPTLMVVMSFLRLHEFFEMVVKESCWVPIEHPLDFVLKVLVFEKFSSLACKSFHSKEHKELKSFSCLFFESIFHVEEQHQSKADSPS